jgi:hypothetical protein
MAVSSIRAQADECLSQFNLLLRIDNEVNKADEAVAPEQGALGADDQLARFRMWAGNIGVFAEGHASLDYRLRDLEDVQKLMSGFLFTLKDLIERGTHELQRSGRSDNDEMISGSVTRDTINP